MKKKNVLIDDDELVRLTWAMVAKRAGVDLDCFPNIQDFEQKLNQYDKSTNFYIDEELGNGVRGQDFARNLFLKGFENIYLTTGHDHLKGKELIGIKLVLSKSCPF